MGAGSSNTRKITVENDNSANVIKISEDVLNRIKGFEGQKVNPGKPITDQPAPTSESYLGNVPPPNYFMSPPLTSLQLRQEREDAIKENDRYWKKRVNQLELNHGEVRQVMDKEYQRALAELKSEKPTIKLQQPPCGSNEKTLVECYKKNPEDPLNCAKEVEAFAKCVDGHRQSIVNRG